MSSTALTVRSDTSTAVSTTNTVSNVHRGWENTEFPIVCERCLGDNPYIRMQVDKFGGTCKMCERPFSLFKWRPGRKEGYKKTEVCQACARIKNLCQCCILDMQLGLPAQLRDAVLQHADGILSAESQKNKDYLVEQQLALLDDSGDMLGEAENEKLLQLARSATQNREQPRVKIVPGKSQQLPSSSTIAQSQSQSLTMNTKRKASAMEEETTSSGINLKMATPPPLPPGITDLKALSNLNLERLPDHMRVFLNHFTKQNEANNAAAPSSSSSNPSDPLPVKDNDTSVAPKEKESTTEVKKANKKVKVIPKPPAGPPPPTAFQTPTTTTTTTTPSK